MFKPDTSQIFLFDEKIGEISEKAGSFIAMSIGNKLAEFTSYNMACDFLTRCWNKIERKMISRSKPGQFTLIF